jgi:hypothetical protein
MATVMTGVLKVLNVVCLGWHIGLAPVRDVCSRCRSRIPEKEYQQGQKRRSDGQPLDNAFTGARGLWRQQITDRRRGDIIRLRGYDLRLRGYGLILTSITLGRLMSLHGHGGVRYRSKVCDR